VKTNKDACKLSIISIVTAGYCRTIDESMKCTILDRMK